VREASPARDLPILSNGAPRMLEAASPTPASAAPAAVIASTPCAG
jgi:hypothetical protein